MDHTLQQQSEWEEPRRPYASTISISLTHTPSNGLNLYTATEKEKKKGGEEEEIPDLAEKT